MKILIDIGHPAHVHFFANPIRLWLKAGCEVVVTSRHKEMATDLLDALNVRHTPLSTMNSGGALGMLRELFVRDVRLYKVVRQEKPDILMGIGGIFAAHVGFLTRIPSLVFYDTENAHLSNSITYPFCSLVLVPSCYQSWLPPWHLRYPGYHELSYLHPDCFLPEKEIAVSCGLQPGRKNFFVRVVSWRASHDIHEKTWSLVLLRELVQELTGRGNVILSSEGELPDDLQRYAFSGPPENVHHLLAFCDIFIGESATMASECAVLGVPAIYAAQTGRGYTTEQEEAFGLVFNLHTFDFARIQKTVNEILRVPRDVWQKKRADLLLKKINVGRFVTDFVLQYPQSRSRYHSLFQTMEM